MNDTVVQALRELVSEHGSALAGDAVRCDALLRERCPANKREVTLLLGVVRTGVSVEMSRTAANAAALGRLGLLARRIEDELGVTADAARWAVEGWARALDWPLEPLPAPEPVPPSRPAPPPAAPPVPAPPARVAPVAPPPVVAPASTVREPAPVAAAPAERAPSPPAPPPAPRRRGVPWLAIAIVFALALLALLWRLLRR